ncbi:MAG TPA: alkene reductase, partial [Spirochaetes bacterium]|nr:alkene reductase [Spirochaetota bacterium]
MKQKDLFSPIQIGPYTLANRIFMPPLTRCRASSDHIPTPRMIPYYVQRVNAGLIITESTFVSPQGTGYPNAPGIYNAKQVQEWEKVTDAVHKDGGHIFMNLWHVGRVSHPDYYEGKLPVAPSAIVSTDGMASTYEGRKPFVTPRALETSEIPGVVEQYRSAAENVLAAGFDGVEIHGANGFLPDQFLRDGSNKRTDQYGGSVENRVRFLLELTEAITSVMGGNRVGIRISPTGTYNSMSDTDPEATFTYLCKALNRFGLAYLHVIEAWGGDIRRGAKVMPLALLREAYKGMIVVNAGYDKDRGNKVIGDDIADAV